MCIYREASLREAQEHRAADLSAVEEAIYEGKKGIKERH